MFAERGEKKPAQEAMKTMCCFWRVVKTEWTGRGGGAASRSGVGRSLSVVGGRSSMLGDDS